MIPYDFIDKIRLSITFFSWRGCQVFFFFTLACASRCCCCKKWNFYVSTSVLFKVVRLFFRLSIPFTWPRFLFIIIYERNHSFIGVSTRIPSEKKCAILAGFQWTSFGRKKSENFIIILRFVGISLSFFFVLSLFVHFHLLWLVEHDTNMIPTDPDTIETKKRVKLKFRP